MRSTIAVVLLFALLGCTPGNFFDTPTAISAPSPSSSSGSVSTTIPTVLPVTPLYAIDTYLNAYGDSITFGNGLYEPLLYGYPAILAAYTALAHTNYAIGNSQSCDIPTTEIFPNSDFPTLAKPGLYTLLISTNDADYVGPGPYEAIFNLCQQASISWLAVPAEYKILAGSATVKTSGATHLESANNWNAVATDAEGASLSFPLQLASAGPVYAWYRISDGNAGAFTCSLDGKVIAAATTGTTPRIATANGSSNSLALLRLHAVPAGAHTLTFTQTSTGSYGMGILAVGMPPSGTPSTMPQVYVGTTPPQLIGGGAPCDLTPSRCQAYAADITNHVNLLRGDNLNVTLFDTGKYMTASPADMLDPVHPNGIGNAEIAHAIEDVLH